MKLRRHICDPSKPCWVPPDPTLVQRLHGRFRELQRQNRLPAGRTLQDYFAFWLSRRRGRYVPAKIRKYGINRLTHYDR